MNILIIASENASSVLLRTRLEEAGYSAESVLTAQADCSVLKEPNLVVAELERNDYDLLLQLQDARWTAPIIILSDAMEAADRIFCIEHGAVYFLGRNFEFNELLTYIGKLQQQRFGYARSLKYGNTILDPESCQLLCGNRIVRLSSREFHIMHILLQSKERIVSKHALLCRVWGADSSAVENHVEVYIGFLRKKLRSIDSDIIISTVRRMGYHLDILHP